MPTNLFKDVQQELLSMCVFDRPWLRACSNIVSQEDFKPLSSSKDTIPWLISGIALEFYHKNHEPLGSLAVREVDRFVQKARISDGRKDRLYLFLKELKQVYQPGRSLLLQEEVINWKKERARRRALKLLLDFEEKGTLTEDVWAETMREATRGFTGNHEATDWLQEVENRSLRRVKKVHRKVPCFMVDPLDGLIRNIGRGQLGIFLAAWKMGKSTALIWTAISYMIQGYNVLYFTLEDPIEDTEDRFDACIAQTPIIDLGLETELTEKLGRFAQLTKARLKIVDGTDAELSVHQIETIWERERNMGFLADAVIIDYDDEIKPPIKNKDRRFELADIYRSLRRFSGKHQLFVWTAAQGTRQTEGKEIISGADVAEDISKIRKVTVAIGIGQGQWGTDARYLNVIAHKFDKQHIGCQIWSDPESGCFYDQQKTLKRIAREKSKRNGHLRK